MCRGDLQGYDKVDRNRSALLLLFKIGTLHLRRQRYAEASLYFRQVVSRLYDKGWHQLETRAMVLLMQCLEKQRIVTNDLGECYISLMLPHATLPDEIKIEIAQKLLALHCTHLTIPGKKAFELKSILHCPDDSSSLNQNGNIKIKLTVINHTIYTWDCNQIRIKLFPLFNSSLSEAFRSNSEYYAELLHESEVRVTSLPPGESKVVLTLVQQMQQSLTDQMVGIKPTMLYVIVGHLTFETPLSSSLSSVSTSADRNIVAIAAHESVAHLKLKNLKQWYTVEWWDTHYNEGEYWKQWEGGAKPAAKRPANLHSIMAAQQPIEPSTVFTDCLSVPSPYFWWPNYVEWRSKTSADHLDIILESTVEVMLLRGLVELRGSYYSTKGAEGELRQSHLKSAGEPGHNRELQTQEFKVDDCLFMALMPLLSKCRNLEGFAVIHMVDTERLELLVQQLQKWPTLQTLNLSFDRIDEGALIDVAEQLPNLTALRVLNLSHNSIGDSGARTLAARLRHCPLETLDLSYNSIGNHGLIALASQLQENESLHTLDLGYNLISDIGVEKLATKLHLCRELTVLVLSGNTIGDAGVTALATGLPNCSKLTTLELGENRASASAKAKLALAKMPALRTFLHGAELPPEHALLGIIGFENVGKTTLVSALDRRSRLPRYQLRTHPAEDAEEQPPGERLCTAGVELTYLKLDKVSVLAFDFAGHPEFYLSHDVLLRCYRQAVFVLVFRFDKLTGSDAAEATAERARVV